jgi:cytochrome b561
MKHINVIRLFSIALLGGLIGLIAARVQSFGQEHAQFSWVGFSAGLGAVLLAFLVSRPIARSANANPPGTPLQRKLLNIALLFFLATLALFTVSLYTGWLWPRVVLAFTVLGGAFSVFAGLFVAWFGPRHEA